MSIRCTVPVVALLALCAPATTAQIVGGQPETKFQFVGEAADDWLGYSVAGIGDVNQDGYDDIIVGALFADYNGTDAGSAYVYSGIDGSLIRRHDGHYSGHMGHAVSSAGDFDGDGCPDVIVGSPTTLNPNSFPSGEFSVFSGSNGVLLLSLPSHDPFEYLGWSVSSAGDVNGDGIDEVIVSAPHAQRNSLTQAGTVQVYSLANGLSPIWEVSGTQAFGHLGWDVSGTGDVNGDGYDDVIVGAYTESYSQHASGAAHVYSGLDGSLILMIEGDTPEGYLGSSVSGAGDVNGDGVPDLIVGAPRQSPNGLTNAGSAYVLSGIHGSVIWRFDGQGVGDNLGRSVSGVGDVDHDGHDDVMVGARFADPGGVHDAGAAYVYSGANGNLIWKFNGTTTDGYSGNSVSGVGDVDGDGFLDVIVGAYGATSPDRNGMAFVYGLDPFLVPTAQEVSISAGGILGYPVDFPDDAAGEMFHIAFSASGTGPMDLAGLEVPLTFDSLVLLTLIRPPPTLKGELDANASGFGWLTIPPGTIPALFSGRELNIAAVCLPVSGPPWHYSSAAGSLQFVP